MSILFRLAYAWFMRHMAWQYLSDLALVLLAIGAGLVITWNFPDPPCVKRKP